MVWCDMHNLTRVAFGLGWNAVRLRFSPFFLLFFFLSRFCWLSVREQYICVLFMNPQISHFSNFFIKNGSHDTIYIFKNYFARVFSVSAKISSIQTDPKYHLINYKMHGVVQWIGVCDYHVIIQEANIRKVKVIRKSYQFSFVWR